MLAQGTAWAHIGVPDLYGRIQVHTTDPNHSNSGLLFAGLLANVMNGGEVVNETTVRPLLPDLQRYFGNLGFMPTKSGDLFGQLMTMGMGANPLVALYESQGLEFVIALSKQGNQAQINQVTQQLRILYPEPTVWANHPFAARTEAGRDLMRALRDPEIQQLAWRNHGERPSVAGVTADPTSIPWTGIKQEILAVTPMPNAATMQLILNAIAPSISGPAATPGAPTSAAAVIPPTSTAAPRRARRRIRPPIPQLA